MSEDKDLAKKLFGKIKLKNTGGYVVDIAEAISAFQNVDSVSRLFCKNCGTLREIDMGEALEISAFNDIKFSRGDRGYFESDGCEFCLKRPSAVNYEIVHLQ